jgi:hypothetical protein
VSELAEEIPGKFPYTRGEHGNSCPYLLIITISNRSLCFNVHQQTMDNSTGSLNFLPLLSKSINLDL